MYFYVSARLARRLLAILDKEISGKKVKKLTKNQAILSINQMFCAGEADGSMSRAESSQRTVFCVKMYRKLSLLCLYSDAIMLV